jgi:hypothetical protein
VRLSKLRDQYRTYRARWQALDNFDEPLATHVAVIVQDVIRTDRDHTFFKVRMSCPQWICLMMRRGSEYCFARLCRVESAILLSGTFSLRTLTSTRPSAMCKA